MTCLSFPPSIGGQSVIMTLVSGGCPVPLCCASLPHTHTHTLPILCVSSVWSASVWELHDTPLMSPDNDSGKKGLFPAYM